MTDRVHFVLPQMLPFYGMEKAAALLMCALARRGWDVTATVLSGGIPPVVSDLQIEALDIPRSPVRLGRAVPALSRRLKILPTSAVIVASGLWGAVPTATALIGTGRSYIAWEHSVLPPRLHIDKRVALLLRIVDASPLRPAHVFAVSEGVRKAMSSRWPNVPASVIPNIVEVAASPPIPAPPHDEQEVRLLTTGAFRPYKNYRCAVEAMRLLPDRYKLRMAGDGGQLGTLGLAVEHLGLADRVQFLGRLPSVAPLLADSHLLVHPSLSETFGFSLVEAADAGVPVVTLSAPAIDELVPCYVPGVMAEGLTSTALAMAVESAASHTWSTEQAAASWRRRRVDFSPAAVAAKWHVALRSARQYIEPGKADAPRGPSG